uniref:Uncharacterized protein n=1 Tax=Hucho hucho TaxID=62062 RepID=A0A4W5NPX5_9TELE
CVCVLHTHTHTKGTWYTHKDAYAHIHTCMWITHTKYKPICLCILLSYNNWFDGMALMHCFHIREGEVTYSIRFLHSDSYMRDSEKDFIVVCEFRTMAMPDCCKNIFA